MEVTVIKSNRKTMAIQVDFNQNVTVRTPYSVSEKYIEEFLKKNGGITRLEYSSLTGLPRLKAIEDLNNFVVAGTLRKRGTGRAVFYVWKQEE